MAINQLFKIKPSKELINEILYYISIDLNNIESKNYFTMNEKNILLINENMEEIKSRLRDYYIPCKKKIYLDNMNIKKFITIIRQLLKLYNYKIHSIDKYNNGKKYIFYYIISIKNFKNIKKDINCIISFD